MTETNMPLIELLQKHDEGDFLRAVTEAVLQTLMEHDVEGMIGAGRYERGEGRQTYRNGYRDRELKTRMGGFEPSGAEAADRVILSGLPRSAPHLGEGAGGGHSGGMDRRGFDPQGRRSGAGDGAIGHLEEHGVQALQGHR